MKLQMWWFSTNDYRTLTNAGVYSLVPTLTPNCLEVKLQKGSAKTGRFSLSITLGLPIQPQEEFLVFQYVEHNAVPRAIVVVRIGCEPCVAEVLDGVTMEFGEELSAGDHSSV
jgi:hypothetical protein